MPGSERRRYTSALRQEQAQATWERIVAAATTVMLDKGFAATSMADVAEAAGVAPQTLYAAVPGGKVGLAQLVYNVTLMGDAAATPMSDRPQFTALIASPDPRFKLRGYAAVNGEVWERLARVLVMLRDAAAAETGAERPLGLLVEQAEERRRAGARECAENVAATGALAAGLTPDRAADRLFALASLEVYLNLRRVCGWTREEYADWLGETMVGAVLEPR